VIETPRTEGEDW